MDSYEFILAGNPQSFLKFLGLRHTRSSSCLPKMGEENEDRYQKSHVERVHIFGDMFEHHHFWYLCGISGVVFWGMVNFVAWRLGDRPNDRGADLRLSFENFVQRSQQDVEGF